MHIERLERIESALRAYVANADIHRFEFNMGIWSGHFKLSDLLSGKGTSVEECCYTAGCAIGLAMHQKIFEKEGLRNFSTGPVLVNDKGGVRYHGFEAIEALFELKPEEARDLFTTRTPRFDYQNCYGPTGALACANRIRVLIDSVKPVTKKVTKKVLELA
jgi:hypothetical protein